MYSTKTRNELPNVDTMSVRGLFALSRTNRLHAWPKTCLRAPIHNSATERPTPPVVFALDIDGVLLHGPKVLPQARRALKILAGNNALQTRIPFVLLTNGGGMGEDKRARILSKLLCSSESGEEIPAITRSQIIQGHTPMREMSHLYADSPILLVGGKRDDLRRVAHNYGFQKVCTTHDVLAWNPSVWPFSTLTHEDRLCTQPIDFSKTPITAIFVFHDSRNWGLDIQVMCDVIQSGGIIGGPHRRDANSIDLMFCNPDLLWRNDFPRPRLAQGSFIRAFQAVYKSLTGSEYPYMQCGKPTKVTYQFAETVLMDQLEILCGHRRLPSVYMIGDNPASDIAGANAMQWSSILVRTGVYDAKDGPPAHKPTHEVEDIEEGVAWALEREFGKLSH